MIDNNKSKIVKNDEDDLDMKQDESHTEQAAVEVVENCEEAVNEGNQVCLKKQKHQGHHPPPPIVTEVNVISSSRQDQTPKQSNKKGSEVMTSSDGGSNLFKNSNDKVKHGPACISVSTPDRKSRSNSSKNSPRMHYQQQQQKSSGQHQHHLSSYPNHQYPSQQPSQQQHYSHYSNQRSGGYNPQHQSSYQHQQQHYQGQPNPYHYHQQTSQSQRRPQKQHQDDPSPANSTPPRIGRNAAFTPPRSAERKKRMHHMNERGGPAQYHGHHYKSNTVPPSPDTDYSRPHPSSYSSYNPHPGAPPVQGGSQRSYYSHQDIRTSNGSIERQHCPDDPHHYSGSESGFHRTYSHGHPPPYNSGYDSGYSHQLPHPGSAGSFHFTTSMSGEEDRKSISYPPHNNQSSFHPSGMAPSQPHPSSYYNSSSNNGPVPSYQGPTHSSHRHSSFVSHQYPHDAHYNQGPPPQSGYGSHYGVQTVPAPESNTNQRMSSSRGNSVHGGLTRTVSSSFEKNSQGKMSSGEVSPSNLGHSSSEKEKHRKSDSSPSQLRDIPNQYSVHNAHHSYVTKGSAPTPPGFTEAPSASPPVSDSSWNALRNVTSVDEQTLEQQQQQQQKSRQQQRHENEKSGEKEQKRQRLSSAASNDSSLSNSPTHHANCSEESNHPLQFSAPSNLASLDSLSSVASIQEPIDTSDSKEEEEKQNKIDSQNHNIKRRRDSSSSGQSPTHWNNDAENNSKKKKQSRGNDHEDRGETNTVRQREQENVRRSSPSSPVTESEKQQKQREDRESISNTDTNQYSYENRDRQNQSHHHTRSGSKIRHSSSPDHRKRKLDEPSTPLKYKASPLSLSSPHLDSPGMLQIPVIESSIRGGSHNGGPPHLKQPTPTYPPGHHAPPSGTSRHPPTSFYFDKTSYSYDSLPSVPTGKGGNFQVPPAQSSRPNSSLSIPHVMASWDIQPQDSFASIGLMTVGSNGSVGPSGMGGPSSGVPLLSSFSFSNDYQIGSGNVPPPPLPHSYGNPPPITESRNQSFDSHPMKHSRSMDNVDPLKSNDGNFHGSNDRMHVPPPPSHLHPHQQQNHHHNNVHHGHYSGSQQQHRPISPPPPWGSVPPHYQQQHHSNTQNSYQQQQHHYSVHHHGGPMHGGPPPPMHHMGRYQHDGQRASPPPAMMTLSMDHDHHVPAAFQAPPPEFHSHSKPPPTVYIVSNVGREHPLGSSAKGVYSWTKDDDNRLTEILKKQRNPKDWEPIAKEHGRGKTAKECHERWIRYLKPGVRKGQWQDHEDAIVVEAVTTSSEQPFTRWSDLAQKLPGRVGKQIRDRWVNHLNPAINHMPFTREDDLLLFKGHQELGKRWVEISTKYFNSTRSENHIKNRWYSASFKKFIANEFGPDAYTGSLKDKSSKANNNSVGGSGQSSFGTTLKKNDDDHSGVVRNDNEYPITGKHEQGVNTGGKAAEISV